MKKLLVSFLLIASVLVTGQAFAATTTIQAPSAVGTYVDFDHTTRLQIKPVSGAVAYKVYLANGNKTRFVLQHTITNPTLTYVNRQYWIYDYVSTPKIQWYTVRVTAVDRYGNESAPFTTSINVWR